MESFLKLGEFPGPLLGMGIDYSKNYLMMFLSTGDKQTSPILHLIDAHRANIALSYVTLIRPRLMGYISLQGGAWWYRQKTGTHLIHVIDWKRSLNLRLGYGFQFYLTRNIEMNLEVGYGAGSFVKGGIGVWVF